jgi:hypothetical protein
VGRVFFTKEFAKFARKNRIPEFVLVKVIEDADAGIVDANLGGCLVKIRVPRANEGKSGGYRTIVAFRAMERSFFLYGYAKNDRASIGREEEEALERYGQLLLSLEDQEIAKQIRERKLGEALRKERDG